LLQVVMVVVMAGAVVLPSMKVVEVARLAAVAVD
jgi:hypothetical protein